MPDTIDGDDGQSISHGMSPLYQLPSITLTSLLLLFVTALVADSCGVDEELSTRECHQSCCLRIPLIPADKYP